MLRHAGSPRIQPARQLEKGGGAGFGAEISSLHDFTPGVSWCILVILVYVLLSGFLDLKVLNVFILAVCF